MADDDRYLGAMAAALRLGRERKRLQAIVDKLPTTADGVPIVPEMTVWVIGNFGSIVRSVRELVVYDVSSLQCSDGDRYRWSARDCYSTRKAAEAAAEAAKSRGKEG